MRAGAECVSAADVRFWPLADMPMYSAGVRFRSQGEPAHAATLSGDF